MEIKEWAQKMMTEELHAATQASTASRRAWHEGQAAAFAFAAGDDKRARNLLVLILSDYRGARETQGRAGFRHAAAMIRGVSRYLDHLGEENEVAWARDAGALADDALAEA